MEQDLPSVKERTERVHYEDYFYDEYHAFAAYDSDPFQENRNIGLSALSGLDISLPSTDLDLETRIFGKAKKGGSSHSGRDVSKEKKLLPEKIKEATGQSQLHVTSSSKSKRCLHMGDSDSEDHVFHPEIVPFEPSRKPLRQQPSDPRYLLDSKGSLVSPKSDPSTARYLKILIPQRDSQRGEGPASETSQNLFESLSTSAAERLLLESPTDSPSHFREAQLRLNTAESEAETSLFVQDQGHLVIASTPKQQEYPQYPNSATVGPSKEAVGEIFDFETELKRMVLEIYSDKEPGFTPVLGSTSNMETSQSAELKVSQARSDLEKAFGGGDEYITSYQKQQQASAKTTLDSFSSMANTSDALALQKSVVGDSSVKPASMEEIAALLASVQQGSYQKNESFNSLESTLQSTDQNGPSNNDVSHDRQYTSMSSLDETPSKIPADYVEPQITPAAVNGVDPPNDSANTKQTREEDTISETGSAASSQAEGNQPEVPDKKAVTMTKRPTSLLAQNTTLAINSAIAHKYKVPPPDEVLSPTNLAAPTEPKLFRSPVQAVTISKGGKIAAMEGLEKPKPKKKKGKKGGRKSAMSSKLVSDTDTEPPSDTEHIPSRPSHVETTINGRTDAPVEASSISRDQDEPDSNVVHHPDPRGTQDEPPMKESSDPPSQQSIPEPTEEHIHPTSPPEVASSGTPQVPDAVPTSAPEPAPIQQAAAAEVKSGSFLGSLFPWGRAEKPTPSETKSAPTAQSSNHDQASRSTNQDEPSQSVNQDEASKSTNQEDSFKSGDKIGADESHLNSDSIDSGIDFVPGASGDVLHTQRLEPLSSSTPNIPRSIERREEIVPQQSAPQYSHPKPTSESVQQAPSTAAVAHTRPPLAFSSRTRPVDLGRLRSTPLPRASTYQSSRYMAPLQGQGEEEDLQTVLREKAKLEGQLEMLTAETESALQSRTQLQSQVAILQAKLKAQGSGGDSGSLHNRSALEADLGSLKQSKSRLEQTVTGLQLDLDSKEGELDSLRRDLQASEGAAHRIQARLDEVRQELAGRETSVSQLKDKMAAMQGQVEQARQGKAATTAKLASLQTDVDSLTKARDWFQEQLGYAQDVRSQLQGELLASQTKAATQASTIETLKTENTKVKQQLTEARQRTLHEKEQIAKHLETIEADIVTREATFSAMQREKTAVQQAVFAQMDQMEEEKYRFAGLIASASELERQLDVAQKELEAKHSALVGLEAEKRELVKGLALAEEALAARETEMEALQTKCNNIEQKLREEQGKTTGQDDDVRQLRADKASLEAALESAQAEKRTFDESLQKLREDLSRVDTGFKQMRQELSAKTSQLESAQMEGQHLKEQVRDQEKQVVAQQANLEASIAAIENKDAIIDELVGIRGQLEKEIGALKQDMQSARNSSDGFAQANSGLQTELSKAREGFQMLEHQLQDALAENANLHGQLESLSEDQQQMAGLMEENAALRQQSADAQSSMHRELAEQKANVLRLGTDLNNVQKEVREKERMYEANVRLVSQQLQNTSMEKDRVERELSERTAAVAQMSKEEQDRLFNELQGMKQDADVLKAERDRLNSEVQHLRRSLEEDQDAYGKRIAELEAESEDLRDILDRQQRNEMSSRSLALDLERERGRLAGVHQSHSALKQHTGLLENALAQRETVVAELSAELNTAAQDKVNENLRLQRLVKEMGVAMEKERQASQDMKKQLANEKGEGNRLRQELQTMSLDTQEVKGQMQGKDDRIAALDVQMTRLKQNEEAQRREQEGMRREVEANRAQVEHLKRLLEDRDAQSPVLQDQMKTLAWQSELKAQEAESLREQLDLAEKRQQIELDGVKSNLQMTNQELEGLKKELASTRKEKFAFQAKLSQLKSALHATLQQNKLLKAKLKSKSRVSTSSLGKQSASLEGAAQGEGKGGVAEEIVVPEIAYDVESLLSSDTVEGVSASQSRPLYAIQSCLQSIKDQMGALEDQMKEHTAAVNTSSEAWKTVGDRVRDLRKASADPLAPSSNVLPQGTPNGSTQPPTSGHPATSGQAMTNGQPTARPSKTSMKQPQIYDL